jgi:hypothetical protein
VWGAFLGTYPAPSIKYFLRRYSITLALHELGFGIISVKHVTAKHPSLKALITTVFLPPFVGTGTLPKSHSVVAVISLSTGVIKVEKYKAKTALKQYCYCHSFGHIWSHLGRIAGSPLDVWCGGLYSYHLMAYRNAATARCSMQTATEGAAAPRSEGNSIPAPKYPLVAPLCPHFSRQGECRVRSWLWRRACHSKWIGCKDNGISAPPPPNAELEGVRYTYNHNLADRDWPRGSKNGRWPLCHRWKYCLVSSWESKGPPWLNMHHTSRYASDLSSLSEELPKWEKRRCVSVRQCCQESIGSRYQEDKGRLRDLVPVPTSRSCWLYLAYTVERRLRVLVYGPQSRSKPVRPARNQTEPIEMLK